MSYTPSWLDKAFVRGCLQKYHSSDDVRIQSLDILPAPVKGENFLSTIIRSVVSYSVNGCVDVQLRLLCKHGLTDHVMYKQIAFLNLYDKEMNMYEHVFPRTKNLLKSIDRVERIYADTLCVDRDRNLIVFEDLSMFGYGMSERQGGFDRTHALQILTKLAEFHATNAVLDERHPELTESFRNGSRIFAEGQNGITNHFHGQMDVLLEVVSSWPDFSYYANKLKVLRSRLMQRCIETVRPEPQHFNTIIHADLWTNNILLEHDANGTLVGSTLIDFQFACWASPTLDLHYFFNTSLEEDLRRNHQHELLQIYHNELVTILRQLGYKQHVPTLHEFHVQFLEKAFYGLTAAFLEQPFMVNEAPVEADIHDLFGEKDDDRARKFRQLVLSNVKVHEAVKYLLPKFDQLGLLD